MNKAFRLIVATFAIAWLIKEIALPLVVAGVWSKRFMELVVDCDTAMEASWYYQQQELVAEPSEITQLLSCHEYDKTRKLMLTSGLPEEYLSWLGLKSLELYQRPAEEFVKQHRFRER